MLFEYFALRLFSIFSSIAAHSAILSLTYAFELVVLTDCPPGPEERIKLVQYYDLLIQISLQELHLYVAKNFLKMLIEVLHNIINFHKKIASSIFESIEKINKLFASFSLKQKFLNIITLIFDSIQKIQMENSLYKANNSIFQDSDPRGSKLKRKPMFDQRGNLQNGVRISFEKGFGFNQTPNLTSAQSIDDNKIVYILGKQIVLYDMLTQNQRVIDTFGQDEQVTCFKYFKNIMLDDNILYALGAPTKSYPTLALKNFSKGNSVRFILSHLQKQQKVVGLDLVNDYKHIAVLSDFQGNQRFSLIDVTTKEVYCSEGLYFNVKGAVVPYSFDKCILLYGQKQIYLLQLGAEVKPNPINFSYILEAQNEKIVQIISSLQNQPSLYLVTDKGNLYFLSLNISQCKIAKWNKQFLGSYTTVDEKGNHKTTNRKPSSLCCNQYNVLIGYQHIQEFTLVKICALNTISSIERISFSCPMLHKIVKMTFAYQTMAVCVIVQVKQGDRYDLSIPIQSEYLRQKGQIKVPKQSINNHLLSPGKLFPVVFNLLLHDTLVQTLRSPIQSILSSTLFIQNILDICIIPTKKLFLVLSAEKKIKAIKYDHISSTSFERMLAWQSTFNQNDQPTSLDTHPLTLSVAVAFKDGLKLFVITSQGLRSTNLHFPLKNCQSVRYSRYGHKLVAGSFNQLIVINPYENRIISTLQMPSGYLVKQLQFLEKDLFLLGIFANGSSMVMTNEGTKIFQVWNKSSKCLCAAYDSIFDIMAMGFPESITKFYRERGTQQFAVMWTYPYNITKLLIVNEVGTIFMGTSLGKIRAHQWPFTDSMKFSKYFTQIQLHGAAITELRVTPDYNLLISGAQDGSVFISRINAISDGISVNDPQLLSAFKSSYKNYKTLYYLQHYLSTSSAIQNDQQQLIGQLQSDKIDFDTQYNDVILTLQSDIDSRLKLEEEKRNQELREEMSPLQQKIDSLNQAKLEIKNEINAILKGKSDQSFKLQEQKLNKIRGLYKETDQLNQKKKYYIVQYAQQIEQLKNKQKRLLQNLANECQDKEQKLQKQCQQTETEYKQNTLSYQQLIKQQAAQGEIYKQRMLQQMDKELEISKEEGQLLRKRYNKLYHDNNNYEEKMKYFQQLMTQLEIDIQNATVKSNILKKQQAKLDKVLTEKDKQILNQEKQVKELLSGNINNYTHEEYLKHKKQELLQKAKFLQSQISALDKKYNTFQQDFSKTSNQAKELDKKIANAMNIIQKLKQRMREKKQVAYLRRYKTKEIESILSKVYHQEQQPQLIKQKLTGLSEQIQFGAEGNADSEISTQQAVDKRQYLIKQVVNANNLRKIDDSIGRTIMVKLNRETVSLTCEVNELRKQKKTLGIKLKQIVSCINDIKEPDLVKQNCNNSQIVPANISIIKKQSSKHCSSHKLLPFQIYHSNKMLLKHNKSNKDLDESSTQLPSLLKQNMSYNSQNSRLFGVQEIQDEMIQ